MHDVVKWFTRINHLSAIKINSSKEHNPNRCQTDPTEHVQPLPIIVNGKHIPKGLEVDIELLLNASLNLVVEVLDVTGKLVTGSYYCPSEVTELTCTQVDVGLQVVVTGVSNLLSGLLGTVVGLLDQVLGLVLGTLACTLT